MPMIRPRSKGVRKVEQTQFEPRHLRVDPPRRRRHPQYLNICGNARGNSEAENRGV